MANRQDEKLEEIKQLLAEKESNQLVHRHFSSDCFNKCWMLIDKESRTPEEEENMVLLSHASLWHWKQREDCQPINLSVAYWQLGRVYYLAGNAAMAKHFGQKCLELSIENNMPPFYVGYGYEVLAKASLLEGKAGEAKKYLRLANEELEKVTVERNRKLLKADLDKVVQLLESSG